MRKTMQQAFPIRFALGISLVVLLVAQVFLYTGTAVAHGSHAAYSCGNESSGHCYGTNDWFGPSGSYLGGGRTDIVVVTDSCSGCSSSLVSTEMWVYDNTSGETQYCLSGECWIETGFVANTSICNPNGWTECYFWADNRANGGFHVWALTLPSDNYGHHTRFKIKNLDNSDWYISVNPLASSDGGFTGYSTSNTMYPQDEQMGQELGGTGGVTAPSTDFTNNEWADNLDNYYYQTKAGCSHTPNHCFAYDPPYTNWYSTPNCCNNGGDFQVWTS